MKELPFRVKFATEKFKVAFDTFSSVKLELNIWNTSGLIRT